VASAGDVRLRDEDIVDNDEYIRVEALGEGAVETAGDVLGGGPSVGEEVSCESILPFAAGGAFAP